MIPSLHSFTAAPVAESGVLPAVNPPLQPALPLAPAFLLGGSAVPATTVMPVSEEPVPAESADPEQLLQLLLDPALAAAQIAPAPVTASLPQTATTQTLPQPMLAATAPPALRTAPAAPRTVAGPGVTHEAPAAAALPPPLKLRTPQDARTASQHIVTLMQTQPEETLLKALPQQAVTQALPPGVTSVAAQPLKAAPLALPEAAQERAAVLREALGERLQMQVDQRSQKATIRLDPPHLGKLDISLHYEGGKLQVQIQAAQPEVYRALQQVSQELRGALSEQNQVAVNVQISQQQGEQRHAPRQQPAHDAVLRNDTFEEVTGEQRHHDLSILTTV